MKNINEHWNKIFESNKEDQLGWFESDFSQTLKILEKIPDWNRLKYFIPGAGLSDLIKILYDSGAQLVLNDISHQAIEKSKQKFEQFQADIKWIVHDISTPLPESINNIDIWVDRAVLHFITEEDRIKKYFQNLKTVLKKGGYAFFAEFSEKGVDQCAGLAVKKYSLDDLQKHLPEFRLIFSEAYKYYTPNSSPRPYIYALFQNQS